MTDDLAVFSSGHLKDIVQDMRTLMSHSQVALLLGAGCSQPAGLPLMSQLTDQVLKADSLTEETLRLLNAVRGCFSGPRSATIEDYMSEIVDLLSIAQRRAQRGATRDAIRAGDNDFDSASLQRALDEVKQAISLAIANVNVDVAVHQRFVRALHRSLEAGRGSRLVDYFILNYDTLIEDALGLERVLYRDGFAGGATGWWEPTSFTEDGHGARVFKVHGSIDWSLFGDDSLPRRVRKGIKTESPQSHVLIYPAATKYQEAQRDPFAQMLAHMRHVLCAQAGNEVVLAICGYSFGDQHIDLEIENALHQSRGRLTVAAFISADEPENRLKTWLDTAQIAGQIRVYAAKGFYHGQACTPAEVPLPWWQFETLTRLLGGER